MTTETDVPTETESDAAPGDGAPPEPPALEAGPDPEREALLTRAILPLALPLLAAFAIVVWVVNLSRAFLASGNQGALAIVLVVTVSIMGGAAFMSAAPRLRTSTMLLLVGFFFMLIVAAGIITLGHSEEKKVAAASPEPKGKPTSFLEVDALPALQFDSPQNFTVKAGIVQVHYVDKGGTHTLNFDDPKLKWFQLQVPSGKNTGKIKLAPGTYTIFCSVDSHRQAGMEHTLTVT
jgi:plastocyanin